MMTVGLKGLRGLTAKDRADWEKKFNSQLQGRSPEEIENAWTHWNFKQKYSGREDFDSLSQLSAAEKAEYWNNDYDNSLKKLSEQGTSYSDNTKDAIYDTLRDKSIAARDATMVYNPNIIESNINSPRTREEFMEKSAAYNEALQKYTNEYDNDYKAGMRNAENIESIADKISPWYRRYKGTDLLPFKKEDWVNMAAEYNARVEAYSQESANLWLQKTIQDTASANQSTAEKWWNGFLNMGASAYAMVLSSTAGVVKGNYDYFFGDHKDIEGAGWFVNYLDAIMDNDVTRYADKVLKTGSIFSDEQEYYEKLGISRIPTIQTYDQETGAADFTDMIFNENFLPTALGQYGFTIGSMLMGGANSKLAGWAFKGIKNASVAANAAVTGRKAMQMRNALTYIQKAENAVNKYAIPGIVGTYEGLMEGLNTKMQFLEEGQQQIADVQSEYVDNKFRELIDSEYQKRMDEALKKNTFNTTLGRDGKKVMKAKKTPDEISREVLEQLYQEAWDSYNQQYKDSEAQLNYDAARAGTNTFLINSAINGVIHQTLQASLFSPNTMGAIRQTRLGKLFTPKGDIRIDGNTATAVLPWYKQAWNMLKEPLGEGLEEYTQDLADAASRGGAKNNLAHFLDNKYNGDASAEIGELWADDFIAAAVAAGEAAISKESFRDAVYGATGSIMGGVHKVSRTTAVDEKGNIIRNEDGSVKKTLFGRGLNSAGEVESNLERVARIIPWRSGAVQAWNENKAQKKELEETAQAITDWLGDPDNKSKYDGAVGTFGWAREMERAAENNDEFGYRTSAMGKAINDAIMLSKLKGTEFYNAFMENLVNSANLESGSQEAQDVIETMRSNIATKEAVKDLSDEEILQQVRDNANKMLSLQSSINESSKKLDKMFGNLDDDTKESLIYGELQIKDWQDRHDKITEELNQIFEKAGIESKNVSGLTDEQKNLVVQHGSVEKAIKDRDNLKKKLDELKELLKKNKKRKEKSPQLEQIIKRQEDAVAEVSKMLERYSILEGVNGGDKIVLSESEIMSLDPVSRAIMLNPKNRKNYSEEQQAVIDNLIQKSTVHDTEFLSKIEDDAKIQQSVKKYIDDYTKVIADPTTFNIYAHRAKRAAAKEGYKKRYESLRSISDYTEFAHAMDQLFNNASQDERSTILRQFERDEKKAQGINAETNYGRYRHQRQQIAEILKNASRSEKFSNMSTNDINMLVHAVTYLTEKGVDLNNQEEVLNTLMQEDTNGNLFEQYVSTLNESATDMTRVDFTSIGEVVQTIKDIVENYNKDKETSAAINGPVVDTQTSSEKNNPHIPPTPKSDNAGQQDGNKKEEDNTSKPTQASPRPGVFGSKFASETLEGTRESQERGRDATIPTEENREEEPNRKSFARNSSEEVAKQAEVAYNMINSEKDSKAKGKASEVLDKLQDNSFSTLDSFLEAIEAEANKLDIKDEENKKAADILRNVVTRIRANAELQKARKEREQNRRSEAQRETIGRSTLLSRALGISPSSTNSDSSNMETVNLQWMKNNLSANTEDSNYSPLLSYAETHRIEEFLQSGRIDRSTPVYFISDPQLEEEQKKAFEKAGLQYDNSRVPLIPVVESEDGTITIGGKKYQPIGIMPATGAKNQRGSNRLGKIRERINTKAEGPELILDEDGKPITTRMSSYVHAEPIGQLKENITVSEAASNDLTNTDKAELEKVNKADRKKHPIYKRVKENFLKRLRYNKNRTAKGSGKTYGGLELEVETLKSGKLYSGVWVREVHKTTDSNSDKTIVELLRDNDPSILTANSRIISYFRELDNILKAFDDSGVSFMPDGSPSEGTTDIVNSLASTLDKKLSNFIRTRGYSYTIIPTTEETSEGKIIMQLAMTDGTNVIYLGNIHSGTISDSEKIQIIRNLIMDGDRVRMKDSFNAVAQWNVNYNNIDVAQEDMSTATEERKKAIQAARLDISNIYDDGILEISKPTTSYRITTVSLESPYTSDGSRNPSTVISNEDNASAATPMNTSPLAEGQVSTSNGSIVDPHTGTTKEGEENLPKSEAQKIAEKLGDAMQADASNFTLVEEINENGEEDSYYEDTKGKKYARVTSIISADEEGERFDNQSPWKLPSTNIGTGVDEFIRDFFAGRFEKNEEGQWIVDGHLVGEVYPNSTQKALTNLIGQLEALKRKFIGDKITIIPRDIIASGTIQVTDSEGKTHTIDVAGTIDLIGYDNEGNWYLYDMKTIRNPTNIQKNKPKWSRQLSLYKKFLEDKYGIKVKELNIIPIQVDYDAPSTRAKYTISEEKHEKYRGKKGNQLLQNGRKVVGTRPRLLKEVPVQETPLNVRYEKLKDSEKQMIEGEKEAISEMLQERAEVVDQGNPEVGTTPTTTAEDIKVDDTNASPVIDPTTNMPEVPDISHMFGNKRRRKTSRPRSTDTSSPLNQYVSSNLAWGIWEGQNLDINGTIKNLEQAGITEEKWNSMTDEERQHELDCKGIKK